MSEHPVSNRFSAPRTFRIGVWARIVTLASMTLHAGAAFAAPALFRAPFIPVDAPGGPRAVTCADMNGDGIADLVIAGYDVKTVSVVLGRGDGTFDSRRESPTAGSPRLLSITDLDHDGRLDVVAGGDGTAFTLFLGDGDGTLRRWADLDPGLSVRSFAVGDIDNDGRADLAVVYNTSRPSVVLYRGNGDGTFSSAGLSASKNHYHYDEAVALGDVNRDGRLDLAVTEIDDGIEGISIALGNGDATFVPRAYCPARGVPVLVDVNGDGALDLIATTRDGNSISVFLGYGDGTMIPAATYPSSGAPSNLTPCDLDGNGRVDLAANTSTGAIAILPGMGAGSFGSTMECQAANGCTGVAVADLTGDGIPDLVTAYPGANKIAIVPGSQAGMIEVPGYTTGGNPSALAVGDLDGDGRPDLAVADRGTNQVSILIADGNGGYRPRADYASVPGPLAIGIADLNQDGRPDIVLPSPTTNQLTIMRGNGDGTLALPAVSYRTGALPVFVAVADLNHDGRNDLVVANQGASTVSVLLGIAGGSFAPKTDYPTGAEPSSIAITDVDRDGAPDLAVANGGLVTFSLLKGRGDGTFKPRLDFGSGHGVSVAAGDLNGDGLPDLAVTTTSDRVAVFLGHGDGTFVTERLVIAGASPGPITMLDANGDGVLDLAVANTAGASVSVLLGAGDGAFREPLNYGAGSAPSGIVAADVTADGLPDLAVTLGGADRIVLLAGTGAAVGVQSVAGSGGIALSAAFPNPARHGATIGFTLPRDGHAGLRVLDIGGRQVRTLLDAATTAGEHRVRWDARTDAGEPAAPGVYFYELATEGRRLTKRMVVVR